MWTPAERRMAAFRLVVVALGLMIGVSSAIDAFGQSGRGPVQPVIRSVRTEAGKDGSTTVVIQATGALPEPSAGTAATPPPRIYLDFTDVLPDLNLQAVSPTAVVKAVRVAEHTASPLVTRVVINLMKATAYRIDSSTRSQGQIAVVLDAPPSQTAGGAPASPPRTTTPNAPVATAPSLQARPAAPSPEQSPGVRGRSGAAGNQYGVRISSALVRLHALRPLLEAIDRRVDSIPGDLDAAVAEFDAIGKLLSGIKPPSSREGTHALLLRTCTLGARAVRMRQEASAAQDVAKGWDAASAAAGAMMMFDRANTDLAK